MTAATVGAVASFSIANLAPSSMVPRGRTRSVGKMSSFVGLKPENKAIIGGKKETTEHAFARMVVRCYAAAAGKLRGSGALTSSCDVAGEIFRVVPIMTGLVLVGVALGFVLLRIEAALEESE